MNWTRQQLLIAYYLYWEIPFGKMHSKNPMIIEFAGLIGRTPSALAMKLSNIASLDSRITSTGRSGLRGASSADREMWAEMDADYDAFVLQLNGAISQLSKVEPPRKIEPDLEDIDYTGKNRVVLTTARERQDVFRDAVLSAYDYRCCISGLSNPRLLVASHIVPWRVRESTRLNPGNGLSLSLLHDKAFYIGLITINEDMTVRVSKKGIETADQFYRDTILSYDGQAISMPGKFAPHAEFLAYHRDEVFEKTRGRA